MASGTLAWLLWPLWNLAGQFGTVPVRQPSRLYGRPMTLGTGDVLTAETLSGRLEELAYARAKGDLVPGSFRTVDSGLEIYRRRFPSAEGPAGGQILRVAFADGRIRSLRVEGHNVSEALLDPPLVASFYGPDMKERRPFTSIDAELPEDLILAVLAIEDAGFLSHVGVSLTGALRAAWTDLMEKELRQGGSTLTQQLVKNLFLTNERTWTRKVREAVLALFLELRFDKRRIFRAYLNEIFWGRSGPVNLMGVGAAAWAYFGKEPVHLTLAESALLAGMIQSPANYSPLTSPERARKRRNVVLERLAELNWIERERLEEAAKEPVVVRQGPLVARRAPYFADAVAEEARRRFGIGELRDTGYVLVSTLSLADQDKAEEAVAAGVAEVAKRWEKPGKRESLQAALVSVDPADGAILAYVGGRDYAASQFDRVANARRQPGSAFKPVVYAAALGEHAATPASMLDDVPFEVRFGGELWSPQNSDGQYHGRVSVRNALERSLNVPTAQLALRTGLEPVIELAHGMGIRGRIDPFPALALGTMEATPLEMATVYATLAAGGVRPELHTLEAVYRGGRRVEGKALPAPERVVDEDVTFLINHALQGVLDRGTARSARQQGVHDALAGKTGTSNDRRDSWFAGFSPDRATLVWVGYDDNSTTRLSGTRGALPIWARFIREVRPPGGFRGFTAPDGVVGAWVDPETGGLATDKCPEVAAEYFLRDFPPSELCPEHSGWWSHPLPQPEGIEVERHHKKKRHRFHDWLEMVRRQRGKT